MMSAADVFVKVAQALFNATVTLIEQVGEAEYAAEVVHAIHERAKESGPAQALPSALGSLVKAIQFGAVAQRAFDVVGAVFVLGVTLPVLIMAIAGILIIDRGRRPIFYLHKRVGLNGRGFKMIKFRTTTLQSTQEWTYSANDRLWYRRVNGTVVKTMRRDPQVLPIIGDFLRRTSVSELPFLINVMRGEMSFASLTTRLPSEVDFEDHYDTSQA